MGSSDVPPPGAPWWLIPVSTVCLGIGVLCWDLTYVLMTRRSLQTRSYGMPVVGLAINVSWEMVYGFYVAEMWFERAGFLLWLALDLGVIYTTVRFAPEDWARANPFVGRNMAWILGAMVLVGCWGNAAFVSWFLSEPGRGSGVKTGKWWRGEEGYDTTELAFWSAGVAQLVGSADSLGMLVARGHSGGTGYRIWLCRFIGSIIGLGLTNIVLWWHWPEAHGYVTTPLSIFILGFSFLCDTLYGIVLWQVRKTEKALPNGRLVRGDATQSKTKAM